MKYRFLSIILATLLFGAIWASNSHHHVAEDHLELKFESHTHTANCFRVNVGCDFLHNFERTNGLLTNIQSIISPQLEISFISSNLFVFISRQLNFKKSRAPPLS